jgi:hypothetical protein
VRKQGKVPLAALETLFTGTVFCPAFARTGTLPEESPVGS